MAVVNNGSIIPQAVVVFHVVNVLFQGSGSYFLVETLETFGGHRLKASMPVGVQAAVDDPVPDQCFFIDRHE